MSSVDLLADTNIVSYLFEESTLDTRYRQLIDDRDTGVTVLSLAELHYGAACGNWGARRRQQLDAFLHGFFVVPAPTGVAEICGSLRAERRRVGREIDLADAWIAATALWYGIPLVTHDRDLEGIPGLDVVTLHEDWCVRDSCIPAMYGRSDLGETRPS